MPTEHATEPIQDSIPKINDEVAVGTDMEFQKRWWRFENALWIFFLLIVIAALLGGFGRGWLAHGKMQANDNSIAVQYDRIARYSTPSTMTVQFGPSAIHDGRTALWADEGLVKNLGLRTVVPQPATSFLVPDGTVFAFPSLGDKASIRLSLEPQSPGMKNFKLRVPGYQEIQGSVLVMP